MTIEIFVNAINEDAGFEYTSIAAEQNSVVETLDTVEDFKQHQKHVETRKTSYGNIEVFELQGSKELLVMDFGEYRLSIID
ncbi:MAG: hypothetical protein GY750_17040 [Lentisphaerae bacterium]|nr:hypothetical protein [Lentisphaerota bacterium]